MIHTLELNNFRNFAHIELDLSSESTIFLGSNGQGKTSILESVFMLSNLRSFRTNRLSEIKKFGTDSFSVGGKVSNGSLKRDFRFSSGSTKELFIDGKKINRASQFRGSFLTVAFLPDDPEIIRGQSSFRRRFFDMLISSVDGEYFSALQRYSVAVKSRNVFLRSNDEKKRLTAKSYDPILAENACFIAEKREFYGKILQNIMKDVISDLRPELAKIAIKIHSKKEETSSEAFQKFLDENFEHDVMLGYTSAGPHLDDVDFFLNGRLLRNYGSRGQCRMVSFVLKLAEFEIVRSSAPQGVGTVVIVDDATGDLDRRAKDAFYERIGKAGQVMYAATELSDRSLADRSKIFTVSSGIVR